MPKTSVSIQVFNQMGGTCWVSRPGYFQTPSGLEQAQLVESVEPVTVGAAIESVNLAEVAPSSETSLLSNLANAETELPAVVLFGAGLDGLWQDESALGWRLWQNIMLAFGWDESQIVFFDTEHLVSEEMMFSTVEEVINLGVEWVLSMDDGHAINEQLVEGVLVVNVPSIELMLSDARAKQLFYTTVRGLVS